MAECRFCNYTGGAHDMVACPASMSGVEKERAEEAWERGYNTGRSGGLESPEFTNPSCNLGFIRGVVALEEAENGFDGREFDDEQIDPLADVYFPEEDPNNEQ